jgi:uncharacterized membrane protein
MAFGRLRIDPPHRTPHRHHHRHRDGNEDNGSAAMVKPSQFSSSWWSDLHVAERKALLMDAKTATVGGAIAAERHLSQDMSLSSDSLVAVSAPSIVVWIGPALLCALGYALYNIFVKKGSASIHPVLGGVILQLVAAILGCVLLGFIMMQQNYQMGGEEVEMESNGLYYDAAGIRWAICAGLAVGSAEMLSFFVSSLGVQGMYQNGNVPTK